RVFVAVATGVFVGTGVFVEVGVGVAVGVAVGTGVSVGRSVGVVVGVGVMVGVAVAVGMGVMVRVALGVGGSTVGVAESSPAGGVVASPLARTLPKAAPRYRASKQTTIVSARMAAVTRL